VALDLTASGQTAGIGRYTRGLGASLLARAAHDYVVFLADRRAMLPGIPAATPVARPPLGARLMTILWHRAGVPWPVERITGPLDVFHAMDFLSPPLKKAASVVTVHDLSFLVCPERADPGLARFLGRRVPKAAAQAHHVLADSHRTRQDLVDLLGVAPDKVTVAYPGLDPDFAGSVESGRVAEVRRRYDLSGSFVLGVGTLEPRKNWPALMRAFAAAELAGATLAIAGGHGWGSDGLEAAARGTSAPVRLLGFVPDADLAALYHAATAFAMVSQYEGFGLPLLEAMACGVPSVVSDGGSLPEVAGDAALVVPVGDEAALVDALRLVWSNTGERQRLRAAGPVRAARFDWASAAAVVEDAYRQADRRSRPALAGNDGP
jgi:glycosyltransferase involved in cell wall biosynthesis